MYYGNLCASLVARRIKNTPAAWNIRHTLGAAKEKWTIRLAMMLAKGRRRSLVIFNSESAVATHQAYAFEEPQYRVIPNGINTYKFAPDEVLRERARTHLAPGTHWIGFVGRMHPHKGVDVFVEAMGPLMKADPTVRLVMVGTGLDAHNTALTALLNENGIDLSRVDLLGRVDEVQNVMVGFDCLVLSSRVESLPNVVLEAMASEVPVVATDVGDVKTLLRDPDRVCAIEDPSALRQLVVRILDAEVDVSIDRERVQAHYHMDVCVQSYVDVYRSLSARLNDVD